MQPSFSSKKKRRGFKYIFYVWQREVMRSVNQHQGKLNRWMKMTGGRGFFSTSTTTTTVSLNPIGATIEPFCFCSFVRVDLINCKSRCGRTATIFKTIVNPILWLKHKNTNRNDNLLQDENVRWKNKFLQNHRDTQSVYESFVLRLRWV